MCLHSHFKEEIKTCKKLLYTGKKRNKQCAIKNNHCFSNQLSFLDEMVENLFFPMQKAAVAFSKPNWQQEALSPLIRKVVFSLTKCKVFKRFFSISCILYSNQLLNLNVINLPLYIKYKPESKLQRIVSLSIVSFNTNCC